MNFEYGKRKRNESYRRVPPDKVADLSEALTKTGVLFADVGCVTDGNEEPISTPQHCQGFEQLKNLVSFLTSELTT